MEIKCQSDDRYSMCSVLVGWVWLCKCYCVYIHTYKICESAAFLATPFSSAFVSLLPLSLLLPCFPPFFLSSPPSSHSTSLYLSADPLLFLLLYLQLSDHRQNKCPLVEGYMYSVMFQKLVSYHSCSNIHVHVPSW